MLKRMNLIAIGAILVSLVSACSSSSGTNQQNSALRLGTLNAFQNLNPYNAYNFTDYFVLELEYPTLAQYDAKYQLVPDFASSWTVSSNGLDWTFNLIHGAKWSDGVPITSADVAFTFNNVLKWPGPAADEAVYVAGIKSIDTPDPNTVVFHYSPAQSNVLANMTQMFIIPQHIWNGYATGDGSALKTFPNSAPVVSGGPFMITEWNGSDFLRLKRNPGFYGPPAQVAEVGIQNYTSTDAIVQALIHNQLDYAEFLPQGSIDTVKKAGLTVEAHSGLDVYAFYINANLKKSTNRELLNPAVREAFAHAMDRQQMVDTAYPGSPLGASIVPPATGTWWNPNVKPETFDLTLANQLLDQAGYPKGPDGIRVANGHKMAYTVLFANDQTGPGDRVFQIIQGDLRQIGIQVTQKTLDTAAFFPAVYGNNNNYDTWDLNMEDIGGLLDPGLALSYITCAQLGSFNLAGYCDPQYDQMWAQQNATLDPSARQAIGYQMQQLAYDKKAEIVLFYGLGVDVHSSGWTGFGANPYGAFNSLSKITFDTIHHV